MGSLAAAALGIDVVEQQTETCHSPSTTTPSAKASTVVHSRPMRCSSTLERSLKSRHLRKFQLVLDSPALLSLSPKDTASPRQALLVWRLARLANLPRLMLLAMPRPSNWWLMALISTQ